MQQWYCQKPRKVRCAPGLPCNFIAKALDGTCCVPLKREQSLFSGFKRFNYKNISSSVFNNGFSTVLFEIHRGVRQRPALPLSLYYHFRDLTIQCNKNIQGIVVDEE